MESSAPTQAQPPAAKKAKVDRSSKQTKISLTGEVAEHFFDAKAKVEASMPAPDNKLTAGGMVHWLLRQASDKIKGLQAAVGCIFTPAKPSGKDIQPGIEALAPGISPSRILPALERAATTVFDEELGFTELDNDPDILAALPEVTNDTRATDKQVDSPPYAYLVTSEALAEFVKLYNHVCMSKDCGHRMKLDRLASISLVCSCLFDMPSRTQVDVAISKCLSLFPDAYGL
jgi:hypothetical protein